MTTTSTATISVAGTTARLEPMRKVQGGWLMGAGSLALALLLPIGVRRGRRDRRAIFSALLLLALAIGLTSCGEVNFKSSTVPPGSYSVTVTATLGSDSHQTTIQVTVK
jgi:hypothetical protein